MEILLVEDDELTRQLTVSVLQSAGHTVVEVRSAEEAQWLISSSLRPDLAIIDIFLPGTNGITLSRHLRTTPGCETLPIILVTALPTSPEVKASLSSLQPIMLLEKPYDPAELLRLLDEQRGAML